MGAFLLTDSGNQYYYDPALELFREMGFSSPERLQIGGRTLYVYSKMATGENNIRSDGNCTIVSVGTPIYKSKNYSDSLTTLLKDYETNNLSFDQLSGQYSILFCRGDSVEILRDPLGCKHIFSDKNHHMLSSHMLPLCLCTDGPLHINKQAVYEKLLTGFIMPPDTLFEDILQIDGNVEKTINDAGDDIRFIHAPVNRPASVCPGNLSMCINEQAEGLRSYFESIKAYSRKGADIGLSGGYDSRLVLACLKQYTKEKIHLHSHSMENDHKNDLKIAKQMADYIGEPCNTISTKRLKNSDRPDEVLRKSILYFDGRSSFSIGGCGEVYTASYRTASTESTPFTLTGVGGELYRNVFDIGYRKIRFDWLMKNRVFSSAFSNAISKTLYSNLSEKIIDKAAARLLIDKHKRQLKSIAHRYYCEIMMPDGQGTALDAYNQVSCCIAPFLEPRIIAKGYEAIQFHQTGGEFEGKLINYIDPGLAVIPSSYGYPVGKRPIKAKIKEGIRTYVPTDVWNKLSDIIYKKKDKDDDASVLEEVYANSKTLMEAYSYLTALFPEINFNVLIRERENIRKVQFMAMTLYYFRERISVQ